MNKKAMKLALEALRKIRDCTVNVLDVDEEIKALEEALAKQEQGEPMAWNEDQAYAWGRGCYEIAQGATTGWKLFGQLTPKEQAYWVAKAAFEQAAPQQRKPLTDEQIVDTFCKAPHHNQLIAWFAAGVRYAEAAHGIKG